MPSLCYVRDVCRLDVPQCEIWFMKMCLNERLGVSMCTYVCVSGCVVCVNVCIGFVYVCVLCV